MLIIITFLVLVQKSIDMRKKKRNISSYQAMMDSIERMIEREAEAHRQFGDSADES